MTINPSNNNGCIIIRFAKFGHQYKLGKLGKFDDAAAYRQAVSICESALHNKV